MACVSQRPQCQELKMLLHKAQEADSIVAAWPAEEIDNHLCDMAQEIKIFPNKKQLKKKLARENNVTFHDGKPVTVISQGTNSRESVIFIHLMFKESERYISFFTHRWPPTAPVTASVLAKAGFYYFGVDDTVQCFSCNGRINNWSPGDTAMGEHKRIYPRCKFVKGMDTRNVPARGLLDESTKQSTEGRKNFKSGKSSASQDEAGCSDENLSELLQPLNLEESEPPSEAKSYFMKEINRLLSFKIWPISSHVDRFDLAAAGFYCVNESTVQCFACFGRLSEWKAGDRPKSEHLRLFPSCPFILGRPTGNVPLTPTEKDQAVRFFSSSSSRLSRPLQIASNLSQSERYGLQGQSSTSRGSSVNLGRTARLPEPADLTVKYAKYPNNAYEQARLETYGRWPNDHSQIPANLARAGFFATGNGDEVKCFYCGGGLKDWSIGDEAWEEHARWFTRCEWLLQQRGPAFVDAVQRKFGPSGHSYFEPNMGIPGDENAILPPTSPPAPPPTGQEQASAAAAEPEPRPAEQRKKKNENRRQTGKKQPDKKKQGKKNKPVNERVEELFQSDVVQFMVDMGQDETLIKTVLRQRLESGQSPYQTSEELLMAIFEEEERQKAGAVSSVPAEEPASPKKKSNERRVSPDQEPTKEEKPRDSSRTSPKRKQPAKHEGLSQQNVVFGQFKLQVADLLTKHDCLMLCTLFDLSPRDLDGIRQSNNPGLHVMHHLVERGIIRAEDVTRLAVALERVNLNRAANQVREYQQNISRLHINSEEVEEEEEDEEEEEEQYNEFEDHDYQTAIQALSDYITPADMTRLCALFALTHRQTEKVRSSDTPAREFLLYLNRRGTIAPDDMTFLVEGLKEVGLVIVAQRLTTMLQEIESKEVEAESAVTVTGDLESQEIEKLREKNLCKICLDNDVEVLFLPCKHLVTCADCATRIDTCPICRTEIDDKIYVYMP
ncbi:uncharacterized protein [Apostichopus japonicus]